MSIPRIVIAAAASGHGKTSVATGLLAAFRSRGLRVSGHKVGPDYIDPGYHALAAGRPGRNLDPWLVGAGRIAPLFMHGATTPVPADIAIVEGVMGLFDGGERRASTADVARLLDAPVVLVVDARGMGASVAALVGGFTGHDPTVGIAGVILNRVGSRRHERILRDALTAAGVRVFGALPRDDALVTPSRHLGLIPALERSVAARRTVSALGDAIGAVIDLDAVLAAARSARPLAGTHAAIPAGKPPVPGRPARIAVAGGAAFSFCYAEHAELLEAEGAEVVPFDPMADERLPRDVDGLVIGGGFPESHADALSVNTAMRRQVRERAAAGIPVAAECAGLLYLARRLDGMPMCGVLDVDARMTGRLTLGYREAEAVTDSALVPAGTSVRGHEFHRTACEPSAGSAAAWSWNAATEGFVRRGVHASYLHLHWVGAPGIASRFVSACRGSGRARG